MFRAHSPRPAGSCRHGGRVRRLAGGCLAALLGCSPLHAEKMVTVRATADAAYAARRAAEKPPKTETYVFFKGRYFSGVTRDNSLANMPFLRMAKILAIDLWKQHYEPAPQIKETDLVIVVHWGVTTPNDRGVSSLDFNPDALRDAVRNVEDAIIARDEAAAAGLPPTLDGVASAQSEFRGEAQAMDLMLAGNDLATASNASLLGFSAALEKEEDEPFGSTLGDTLHKMVDEERYFIILMAYDAKAIRAGKMHRLWTSRLSIRSAGVNFTTGLDRMSSTGANFFGTRQTGLALEQAKDKDRTATVTVGEVKVVGDGK